MPIHVHRTVYRKGIYSFLFYVSFNTIAVLVGASIENYRPFKSASVVDMNEDNSEGLAWGLSATHAAKSTAVEMLLDDEEAEAEEVPLFSLPVDFVAASFFMFV